MNVGHLIRGAVLVAVAPLAFAATSQHVATVERHGEVYTCHSVLTEIPSHRVLADQTVQTNLGDEGQAVSGSRDTNGSEMQYRMSCLVSDRSSKAVVKVRMTRTENGVVTFCSTRITYVKVTDQPAN